MVIHPIDQLEFGTYGNKAIPPTWLTPAPINPLPPGLSQTQPSVDLNFDRAEVLRDAEIPEIMPAVLGLRSILIERKITRIQSKLERTASKPDIINFIGKSILNGAGYSSSEEPLRPTNANERVAAKKLDALTRKRRANQAAASNIESSYPGVKDDPSTLAPLIKPLSANVARGNLGKASRIVKGKMVYEHPEHKLSINERRNISKNAHTYKKMNKKNQVIDKKFEKIIGNPKKDVDSLISKRNSLVRKSMAIDLARYEGRGMEKKAVAASNSFDRAVGFASAKASVKAAKLSLEAANKGSRALGRGIKSYNARPAGITKDNLTRLKFWK